MVCFSAVNEARIVGSNREGGKQQGKQQNARQHHFYDYTAIPDTDVEDQVQLVFCTVDLMLCIVCIVCCK